MSDNLRTTFLNTLAGAQIEPRVTNLVPRVDYG